VKGYKVKTSTKSIVAICLSYSLFSTTVKAAVDPATGIDPYQQIYNDMTQRNSDNIVTMRGDIANISNNQQVINSAVTTVQNNQQTLLGAVNDHETRIESLENAPKPKDGVDGKDGATGAKGEKGDKGDSIKGDTGATGAQGLQGVAGSNGKDGVDGVDGKPGLNGANGKDGSNGKDGVTTVQTYNTTTVKHEVDQATQKAVAGLQQAQTKQANAFKSLKDTVDNNHKQANAGISGAMAMAGLPQVQTNQRVMFSAGGATYNGESALAVGGSVNFNSHVVGKVSFSTDTANNMGASVGVGVGF
jgi:hypothetical protein